MNEVGNLGIKIASVEDDATTITLQADVENDAGSEIVSYKLAIEDGAIVNGEFTDGLDPYLNKLGKAHVITIKASDKVLSNNVTLKTIVEKLKLFYKAYMIIE